MRVLVLGISGAVARRVALRLWRDGHQVEGVDARGWPGAPPGIPVHRLDLVKRATEDLFRTRRPEVVIHQASVASQTASGEQRHRLNLGGTQAVFEHCVAHGVKHCLFVGRHTFYGAAPNAPLFHRESEPPKELSRNADLVDLVAADLYAGTQLWRFPELVTTVLRVCYTLGPSGRGTLGSFLRGPRVPTVLGHDPLFQFLHEDDATEAIVRTVEKRPRGVFNVAGPQPVPLSILIRRAGRHTLPLPAAMLGRLQGRLGLPALPPGAANHLMYPIVVDGAAFVRETGFQHAYDEVMTLEDFRRSQPLIARGSAWLPSWR